MVKQFLKLFKRLTECQSSYMSARALDFSLFACTRVWENSESLITANRKIQSIIAVCGLVWFGLVWRLYFGFQASGVTVAVVV